jgi:hypothetical protein
MIYTPGKIRAKLPMDSYRCLCKGVAPKEDLKRAVMCHMCNKTLQARCLCTHLSSAHDIHQQVVVAEALLEEQAGADYRADPVGTKELIQCPFPGCLGVLSSNYMLQQHFWDLNPKVSVEIPREGFFSWCKWCTIQCHSRTWPLWWTWPSKSCSALRGSYWRKWICSGISNGSLPRTTMMSGQ